MPDHDAKSCHGPTSVDAFDKRWLGSDRDVCREAPQLSSQVTVRIESDVPQERASKFCRGVADSLGPPSTEIYTRAAPVTSLWGSR